MQPRILIPLALLAALINLLPLLLMVPSGDMALNLGLADCFAREVWQGNFYPRWCMAANGGLGSPQPIFYFPLPYYVTALFAPLMDTSAQYLAGVYLANVAAFIGCALWLGGFARPKVAYFCAFLFLFAAYRGELTARASYAEYWCVALLPLLFYYTRKLCDTRGQGWPPLALVTLLCLLCHAPVTLIGLMGAGIFVLGYARMDRTVVLYFALAALLASMAALFHYLPASLLLDTLNPEMGGINAWKRSWVNGFLDSPDLPADRLWARIGVALQLLIALGIGVAYAFRRKRIADRREAACWIGIGLFALFMMLSASEPLWRLIEAISGVRTPWRMPSLIALMSVLLLAVLMEHVWRHRRTRAGDALMLALFFILCHLFYYGGVAPASLDHYRRILAGQYMLGYSAPRGVDAAYDKDISRFFAEFVDRPQRRQAEWSKGGGTLDVGQWNEHGIVVTGRAREKSLLRIEHFNYPIWQATLNGTPAAIETEPATGRMLVAVPKGDFNLILTRHYPAMLPAWFSWVWAVSGAAVIGIALGLLRAAGRGRAGR